MPDIKTPNPEDDPLIGKLLADRYLVKQLIDRGGMGKVYSAEQQPLKRMVALKTLDLLDPRGEFKERFFNEASTASRLRHPNTVRIFDYGRSEEGVYFLTMELLEGQSLHKLVKSHAPLPPDRIVPIIRQVCGALHEAHEQGIVHRDLKPGNIYLTKHGDDPEFAKVLDFGLVKNLESDVSLSQTGQALGSPLYMAPEQVEGDPVDRRSDLYSLGLVLYVALCGRVPFKKGSVATIMMQQVTGSIPTFDEIHPGHEIPASLEWIVRRCIEKDRSKRIASMRELSSALRVCMREMRGEFTTPVPWALDAGGNLALPAEYLETVDESQVRGVPLEINDIPSSATLNRSSAATVGAAVFGAGSLILLAAAAITIVLLLGVLAWALTRDTTVAPKPEPPTIPKIEVKPPPTVVAPANASVDLASDPEGAEVTRGDVLLGPTPLTVTVPEGETMSLHFEAAGYEPRDVVVDGSIPKVTVKMNAKRRAPRPTRPAPAPPPAPVEPAPTPKPPPEPKPKPEFENPFK